MVALKIDQNIFTVKEGISILEACQYVGIKIPRFCYHETLSIAGNCRMCLIKLEADDKLLISCLTEVDSDMEILSNDPIILKVREEIIEFLLLNHPLDCPICDQGGECDLQDQTKIFGSSNTKFNLNKTSVEDKDLGTFIKSIMTRCIHCTRCVRFSNEIIGLNFFGTLSRGNLTEIGLYSADFFNSEISGNVIDLCPVGALTSKPYTFKSRPWELKSLETIDLTDSMGSNIYINFTEANIARIIPKLNSEINETIISDKARFSYDAFYSFNNLTKVSEFNINNNLKFHNTDEFITKLKSKRKTKNLILFSDDLNFESMNLLKKISIKYSEILIRSINTRQYNNKNNIFLNPTNNLKDIKDLIPESIFFLALNPRTEIALINNRIRFLSFNNYIEIYNFGYKFDSTLKNSFLNISINALLQFIEGKFKKISSAFINSNNALVLSGHSLKERGVCVNDLQEFFRKINPSIVFLKVPTASNYTGSLFLNFKPVSTIDILKSNLIFIIKCRETSFLKKHLLKKNVDYIFFSNYVLNFKLINNFQIPIKNIYEEEGTYFNLEFRPQISRKLFETKMNAKSIFNILISVFNIKNPRFKHNSFIYQLLKDPSIFIENSTKVYLELYNNKFYNNTINSIKNYPIKSQIIDFFRTSYFTDYSKNMLIASQEFQKRNSNFF